MNLRTLLVAVAAFGASTAWGTILDPGGRAGRGTPDAPGDLTIFADQPAMLDTFSGGFANASINGTVTSAVYLNSLGTLDFYVQVTVGESSDPIGRVTLYNFASFLTDVGHRLDAYGPYVSIGAIDPSEANRNASGSTVGFDYDLGATGLNPGTTSYTMVVRTDATEYTFGNVAIINGVSDNVRGFAPVPEPASLAILGVGILALLRRKRA
ncbi:MAG TPA: PEP-CTERM sorting domain-containing protein [Fimbriimonadaceae bacterium]|nr:PEP-CTERM sorting domain-containing protein [Fimbriimonadaceae bacterium]